MLNLSLDELERKMYINNDGNHALICQLIDSIGEVYEQGYTDGINDDYSFDAAEHDYMQTELTV
jgi:hypothetical protein